MAIVAIFAGSYCHGEDVAGAVAARLGYERIEGGLFENTARRFGVQKEKLIRAMTHPPDLFNGFTHEKEKCLAYLKIVLAETLLENNKLIYGYAAHLISQSITHALRVCVIANFAYRAAEAARAAGASKKEAEKLVRRDDEQRLCWTQYLFDKPPYDEGLYDLVVPMHGDSIDEAVKLICDTAGSDPLKTTAVSELAARDFALAAKAGLAMADAGYDVEVTAEHGVIVISLKHHVLRMARHQEELKTIALKVPGASAVKIRLGPRYRAPKINTMSEIDLPPKILLVDDEREFVQTLSERLKKRKLESTVVYDGEQALEHIKSDQPDVMVLDLMMPGIGGIEVLRRLKQTHPNIEVIILTGHGSEHEQQQAKDLGAFAYLKKPVDIEVLAAAMRAAYAKVSEARQSRQDFEPGTV